MITWINIKYKGGVYNFSKIRLNIFDIVIKKAIDIDDSLPERLKAEFK